ncbi:MAG: hypothetical protein EOP82_16610 [Variovorax sp.]|nr:MAG: hypothetical protein EOP82_16610 [Variovorax sp.]
MSMELLRHIAGSPLPMSFRTAGDIDKIKILRSAGLVIAFIPAPYDPPAFSGPERAARVLAVTEKGREELERMRYPDEDAAFDDFPDGLVGRIRAATHRAVRALH